MQRPLLSPWRAAELHQGYSWPPGTGWHLLPRRAATCHCPELQRRVGSRPRAPADRHLLFQARLSLEKLAGFAFPLGRCKQGQSHCRARAGVSPLVKPNWGGKEQRVLSTGLFQPPHSSQGAQEALPPEVNPGAGTALSTPSIRADDCSTASQPCSLWQRSETNQELRISTTFPWVLPRTVQAAAAPILAKQGRVLLLKEGNSATS